MRFLCLGYLDAGRFDAVPQVEKEALLAECFAQCLPFRETGKVILEEGVGHFSDTKCIRPVGGLPVVTQGSFIPSEFQLGSVFIIEADSMEEAIEVASLHPAARLGEEYGFGIEIRPLQ